MTRVPSLSRLVTWAKAETGWTIEIISGLEEGRLIHRGVASRWPQPGKRVLIVDIGGGTCDLMVYADGAIVHTSVLPLGGEKVRTVPWSSQASGMTLVASPP